MNKVLDNIELFETLVRAYGEMQTAPYSSMASAIDEDTARFKRMISKQNVFTEKEIGKEYAKRYDAWLKETNAEHKAWLEMQERKRAMALHPAGKGIKR